MTADDEESTHNKIQNFNRETIYAKIISSNIIFTMNGRMQIEHKQTTASVEQREKPHFEGDEDES